jgi:hypothetical protein
MAKIPFSMRIRLWGFVLRTLVDLEALVRPFSPGSTLRPGLKGFH